MNEFNNSHMYYKHDNFYNNKKIERLSQVGLSENALRNRF